MIDINISSVWGFKYAMKIMRLPLESSDKSDSGYADLVGHKLPVEKLVFMADKFAVDGGYMYFMIGPKDKELSKKLFKAGPDHSKHLDHIIVQCEVTGPRYWLAELMTYSTVPARPVSGSTMHNLLKRPVAFEDFEQWNMTNETQSVLDNHIIPAINKCIEDGNLLAAKALLPESYKQTRGFTFNYTNLANIYRQRKNHKLKEWKDFCKFIEELPYSELIIGD